MLSNSNPVPKLYLSIIDDVIDSMRELFVDEGIEERVLEDLKRLWESKVMQSQAVDGFMKNTLNPSNFVLQLPANYTQALHKPTASIVIPAGQNVQSFTTKANSSLATFSLPPGVSYPVQIPAGVTLQTSSGHLYKVNVPVMVTQAPEGHRILPQTIQHVLDQREPPGIQRAVAPAVLQTIPPPSMDLYPPPAPAGPVLRPNEAQSHGHQQPLLLGTCTQAGGPPVATPPTHPPVPQPTLGPAQLPPDSPSDGQFTLEDIEFSPLDVSLSSPYSASETQGLGSEAVVGKEEAGALSHVADNSLLTPENPAKLEMGLMTDYNCNVLEDIVQLDGLCDSSSEELEEEEEEGVGGGMGEDEFLGMINAEALKALQEGEGSTGGSSSSSGSDGVEDLVEEEEEEVDPLNSEDDVSEQDVPDLFDTDNVVVCQYDKIHRSKNRWKFYLKDGVMSFGGKDYVFSKAVGEAEW